MKAISLLLGLTCALAREAPPSLVSSSSSSEGRRAPLLVEDDVRTLKRTFLERTSRELGDEEIHDAVLASLLVGYRELFHNGKLRRRLGAAREGGGGG